LPKQSLPKQQLPKQQLPKQQLLPKQQSQQSSAQKLPKQQQLSVDQLSQQLLRQLIQKQIQGQQPQGVPVQFHQLPSNAQDVLRKQMSKEELQKLQQSNAKFIVVGSSQDKPKAPQAAALPSTSKQPAAIQPAQLSTKQMPASSSQQKVKQPTVGDVVSAIKPLPQQTPKKEDVLEKQKQKQLQKQRKLKEQQQQEQKQQQQQQIQLEQEQQQHMDVEPSATSVTKEADMVEATTSSVKEVDIMLCFVCLEERYVHHCIISKHF